MTSALDQQRLAPPSFNGRTSPFDGEDVGSSPAGGAKAYTIIEGDLVELSAKGMLSLTTPVAEDWHVVPGSKLEPIGCPTAAQ